MDTNSQFQAFGCRPKLRSLHIVCRRIALVTEGNPIKGFWSQMGRPCSLRLPNEQNKNAPTVFGGRGENKLLFKRTDYAILRPCSV